MTTRRKNGAGTKTAAPATRSDKEAAPVIVGIGASAGGLQAFEAFLATLPADAPVAIVFIQHLEPNHTSHMVDLVRPYSQLGVHQAEQGQRLEVGNVYVGPPGQYVSVKDGVIHLTPMGERRGIRYPIDRFLRSLAEDQGERSIAVILTGTGNDGTAGTKAIKVAGGTVYVQDPDTAEHRGMPASAIEADVADEVLPLDHISEHIVSYVAHPFIRERPEAQDGDHDAIAPILDLLRSDGAVDFRNYKTLTLKRRIERRMGLQHTRRIDDYRSLLERDPAERERLQHDLLISVTEFFRDSEAWRVLADEALSDMLAQREDPDRPIRAWVAGCATGEEAYTLMMLLIDRLGDRQEPEIQLFATDVSAEALAAARAASYPSGALEHVPKEYVKRFFRDVEGTERHRLVQAVREPVTFALHDLLNDPPFSRLDIITCRNLLIYLTPEAQARVLHLFHFALRPGGLLVLGSAEGRGPVEEGFEVVSKKWRIYRRTAGPALLPGAGAGRRRASGPVEPPRTESGPTRKPPARRSPSVAERAKAWLVAAYAPAAVVIDHQYEIIYLHGPLGKYLELPRGEPALDLSRVPREGLRPHLRGAVREAIRTQRRVDLKQIAVHGDDKVRHVDVRIEPLAAPGASDPLIIVAFQEASLQSTPSAQALPDVPEDDTHAAQVQRLVEELQSTQDELRATVQELESADERLRVSEEEILSMSEEFRSTNEELETSKEELQSLNEELTALNTQLQSKVEKLEATTDDLENLLRSTDIPTLFLDGEARIRLFTPSMTRLMNLIPSDQGRSIMDITQRFDDRALAPDLDKVRKELVPQEKEVVAHDGHRFLRRVQPYRTTDDRITGTVVTFLDIENVKRAADAVDVARRYAEGIVETLREPIVVLDEGLRVLSANEAFCATFGYVADEVKGTRIYDLGGGEWDFPALHELLERVLPVDAHQSDYEIEHEFEKTGHRSMVINAQQMERPVSIDGRRGRATLLAFDDITERKAVAEADAAFKSELERRVRQRTAELEQSNRILREANQALDAFSYVVGHDLKEPTRAIESVLSVIEEDHQAELPDRVEALVKQARAANRRLSSLVVGLLRFSRTAASGPAEPIPVRLADLFEDADFRARFEAELEERSGRLEMRADDVTVMAEPEVLGQVLGNLVLNALKHNPKKGPHVRVRTEPHEVDDVVHLVVEDDGEGFAPEIIGTFSSSVWSTREGGFGLVIAKRGVARMQGTIWLGRSPLGGAAVHITLPAARAGDDPPGQR